MKNNITGRRLLAFSIDYLVIAVYGLLLFGIATLVGVGKHSPFIGQLVGFITLTLPIFLYFF